MNNPPRPSRILFPIVLLIALAVGFALVSQSPSSATQSGSRVALQTTPDAVEEAKPTDAPAPEAGTPFGPITGATAVATVAVTPVPGDPYDPATYGIPASLGGVPVVVVFTAATHNCLPIGTIEVVLQDNFTTFENFKFNMDSILMSAREEVAAIDTLDEFNIEFSFVGVAFSRNDLISEQNRINAFTPAENCTPILSTTTQFTTNDN